MLHSILHRSEFFCLAVGLIAVVVVGCGRGSPFEIRSVTGKVTYEDGSLIPVDRLTVSFVPPASPINQKTYPRPAVAEVDVTDGGFSKMTTWKFGDGAIAGRHKVLVRSFDQHGNLADAVPGIYSSPGTTPLEVEVGSGSTHFELKIRKK